MRVWFSCEPHAKLQHPHGQRSNHALPKRGSKAAGLKAAGNASAFQSADCLLHPPPSSPDLLRTCPSAAASDSRPPTSNESWFRKRLSQPLTIPRFHLRLGWGARVAPLPAPSLPPPPNQGPTRHLTAVRHRSHVLNSFRTIARNWARLWPLPSTRAWYPREWRQQSSGGEAHSRAS